MYVEFLKHVAHFTKRTIKPNLEMTATHVLKLPQNGHSPEAVGEDPKLGLN